MAGTPFDAEVVDEGPRERIGRFREARERRRSALLDEYEEVNKEVEDLEEALANARRARDEVATELKRAGIPIPKRPGRATVREATGVEATKSIAHKITVAVRRWW
ncbi:MAG: hypothetical protein HY376_00940 [Candidatus Blackburnbacteria bacterium]|nr:hypothetical protein [Candidatus Blackburnbacteria bacterium]